MKKIIRVFPTKTNATPTDELVRVNTRSNLFDEADEIHISVAFSWDLPKADILYSQWKHVAPTMVGGPATGMRGEDFTPGRYMKKGYVITSRGCYNRCWFCSVWKREGDVRELPITDGWNVTDDNLLACSVEHIQAVFAMLRRQKEKPAFTGGLEAKRLTPSQAVELKSLNPVTLFFANDTDDDLEPLIEAGKMLTTAGFKKDNHIMRSYVLCGYKGDTFDKALLRMKQTWQAGFMPMAMLYRDKYGSYSKDWKRFQREWANPYITAANLKRFQ